MNCFCHTLRIIPKIFIKLQEMIIISNYKQYEYNKLQVLRICNIENPNMFYDIAKLYNKLAETINKLEFSSRSLSNIN